MVFEIKGKVALITGGAAGIGLLDAKELLRQGLKGVTLADVNEIAGKKAVEELEKEFGQNKVIFVKTDVTNKYEFENAFKKTVEYFKNIDILINNAGIYNDAIWEKEVDINLKGTINGVILGLEDYLRNHKQGEEAVIVNTSSLAGLAGHPLIPVYSATKFGITGLTKCWGTAFHYDRTKVRVVSIHPGPTSTDIVPDGKFLIKPEYEKCIPITTKTLVATGQSVEHVSKELARIIKYAKTGTLWGIESDQPAYEFILPDRETFKGNILKEDK